MKDNSKMDLVEI